MLVELFNEHARSLVNLARLFVDHRDAAEDIVQEAFIRLDRSLHRIQDRRKAAAYLRSIVLNLARDHNRRGLLSLRHAGPVNDLDPRGVEEEISIRKDQQTLVGALGRLPRRQRDCLALHYLLELTVPEVADTLALSPNSVKTHLKRGLSALRLDENLVADVSEQS